MGALPFIIFVAVIIVVNVLKAASKNAQRPTGSSSPGSEDWWEEDAARPTSRSAAPRSTPETRPSERVREILEMLQEQAKPPAPKVRTVPPPVPPAPPRKPKPAPAARPPAPVFTTTEVDAELGTGVSRDVDRFRETTLKGPAADIGGGVARDLAAFRSGTLAVPGGPAAPVVTARRPSSRRHGSGTRPAVRVDVVGRDKIRQGILMAEILGPPRAFDI